MIYEKVIIYYFSGTGNAKKSAEWILDEANKLGAKTEIFSIEKSENLKIEQPEVKTLIGFCSPTHGFNLPPIMLKFIWNFPKLKNSDIFILNTRGGMKFLKLFTPGLSGVAHILPAIFLWLKFYKIVGFRPIDLPSNWISLHPGIRRKVVDSIIERCERISRSFITKILSGKKVYRGLLSLPIDLLISPISLGYYLIGRFGLAKTFIATDACTSCELCVKQCPVNALKMKHKTPYWTFDCESCMRCMNMCPHRAIEIPISYLAIVWYFVFGILPPLLINQITEILKISETDIITKIIYNILSIVLMFGFMYFSHKILHFLMRFKIINKIITYTSLTKYKFWRRYKFPKK